MVKKITYLLGEPKLIFYAQRTIRKEKIMERERLYLEYIKGNLNGQEFVVIEKNIININFIPVAKRIIRLGTENKEFDLSQEIINLKNFSLHTILSTIMENFSN
jgi:hypothetical protein